MSERIGVAGAGEAVGVEVGELARALINKK